MAPPAPGPEASAALAAIDAAMRRHQGRGDALIEVLHVAQRELGWLSEEALLRIARGLGLPPSRVWGVATFYNLFTLRPRAPHACTVCMGTACWVRGAGALLAAAEGAAGGAPGISVGVVRCIGACGGAPVVAYDGRLAGREGEDGVRARLAEWSRA